MMCLWTHCFFLLILCSLFVKLLLAFSMWSLYSPVPKFLLFLFMFSISLLNFLFCTYIISLTSIIINLCSLIAAWKFFIIIILNSLPGHSWISISLASFNETPRVGDGQGDLACCDSWGLKELDTAEWLNWTELNENYCVLWWYHV